VLAKPSWRKSLAGALVRPIIACCSPPPWTCSIYCSLPRSKLKIYTEPTLLIVDELAYLSLDQQSSNLFYQVISTRHSQKRSTVITTNTTFSDWGNIQYNTTIATAIADRLVEDSEIFLLGGDSLRKAGKNPNPPAE
jgi:DNA replication protein DnaC